MLIRFGKYKKPLYMHAINLILGPVKILPHLGEIILINRHLTPHSLVFMMLPSWVMKSLQKNNTFRDHRTPQFNPECRYSDIIHRNSYLHLSVCLLPPRHWVNTILTLFHSN